jgi:uncharacterized protein YqjF (DUF2071 family)
MSPTSEQRLAPLERPSGVPVGFQRWRHLLFLHWEVPIDVIAETLPKGLHVDEHEGRAYLGIVPFFMQGVRPRFLPPIPGISSFLELNLRTYVFDDEGRPGVWFYSLDANQSLAVRLARHFFHLPYKHAHMSASIRDESITYQSSRSREQSAEVALYQYEPDSPEQTSEVGSLEFFLLERYLLFAQDKENKIRVGQVHHERYPIQKAKCQNHSTLPFSWNGFIPPETPPISALYSRGVDVSVYPLCRS